MKASGLSLSVGPVVPSDSASCQQLETKADIASPTRHYVPLLSDFHYSHYRHPESRKSHLIELLDGVEEGLAPERHLEQCGFSDLQHLAEIILLLQIGFPRLAPNNTMQALVHLLHALLQCLGSTQHMWDIASLRSSSRNNS